jgi:poly(beta-D-mannuronate) lyase
MKKRLALLLCVAALALGRAEAAPEPAATSCADLTRAFPGTPCSFDFGKFRLRDPRLDRIAGKGFAGSGYFTGTSYLVRNAADVAGLAHRLKPGDEVVIADGEWRNRNLAIGADGSAEHPILIRAQTRGGAVFTGTSSVAIWGSNIVVSGLSFRGGVTPRNNFVVFRLGNGKARPCDACIADHIAIDGTGATPRNPDPMRTLFMVLGGHDITVANSALTNKASDGAMVEADLPATRLLFIGNLASGFEVPSPLIGDRVMQLGGADATQSAYAVIAGNTFEHITGDNNTIAIKASDVIVRGNTFRANRCMLDIRSGNRALIEGNLFDGAGIPGMGGVLLSGKGHWVVHNTFRGLYGPANDYCAPVGASAGADEDLRDGAEDFARVKEAVIAGNRFENCAAPLVSLGIYPRPALGRTLLPKDVFVLGNSVTPMLRDIVGYNGPPGAYQGIVIRTP